MQIRDHRDLRVVIYLFLFFLLATPYHQPCDYVDILNEKAYFGTERLSHFKHA